MTVPFDDAHYSVALGDEERSWRWRSLVNVRAPWGEFEAFLQSATEGDGYLGHLCPHNASDREALSQANDLPVQITSRSASGARWSARARLDGEERPPLGFPTILERVSFDRPVGLAAFNRIVYRGLRLPSYRCDTWIAGAEVVRRRGHTPLRLFGRDIVISEIAESDDDDGCFIGVTISTPWLEQSELDALDLTFFLLCGTGGVRQCVESYDADGRWLGRSFHRLAHARPDARKEVFPRDLFDQEAFYAQFVSMVEIAKELIVKGFPLRAILFQLFTSQQPVPELEITLLAIALDGTKTAVIEKIRGEGTLLEQPVFDRRIRTVVAAAEAEFAKAEEAEALVLILRKIRSANDWSERERWKRFWRDCLGYQLTEEEHRVLDHRGAAIHNAYILDTEYDLAIDDAPEKDRRPYDERLRDLDRDASIFRNIVVRMLLMLLGYEGEFNDATAPGLKTLWISPTSDTHGDKT